MAATGTIGYFTWTKGTAMIGLAAAAFEVHGTLANVMWGYLIVHVGAALLHELLGHRMLYRMSPAPQAGGSLGRPQVSDVVSAGELRRPRTTTIG